MITTSRDAFAAMLAGRGIHYGWAMVALAFLHAVFASASMGVPSVLIVPMSEDLGWSLGELSAPQGLRLAIFGLTAPFAGGLMLRYGPRAMITVAGACLVVGLYLAVTTTTKWELWLGQGVLLGIAPGLTASQISSVIASRWFKDRQGMVLGVLGGTSAAGMLLFMPLAGWVSIGWGWRVAMSIPMGGAVLSWLLFVWLARDRPQELGLPLFGDTEVQPAPPPYRTNFVRLSFSALSMGSKRWVFWVLVFSFGICGVSSFGLTSSHLIPFCGDIGVPYGTAAWVLATIGVFDLIGTLGSGWLSDRYDNRWLLGWYYGLRGLSLIWLVYANPSFAMLSIFAIVYGLDFIATLPPTIRLTVGAFGREMGPAVFGWIFASHHVAAGLMAVGAGVSRDVIGTYVPAFLFAGILCLFATASFFFLRRSALQNPAMA